MTDPLLWHRLQFGFTITFHYLFPQLSLGLALLIVIMKALALRTRAVVWNDAARFWIRIFGLTFAMGVVTGIPMEFQFGTNWAQFTAKTGSVIGQTLAMEGLFAFFLESSFLALLIWGELAHRPWSWLCALAAMASIVASAYARKHERDLTAFVSSGLFLISLLLGSASVLFPDILRSASDATRSLGAFNASADAHSLQVAVRWWPAGLVLVIAYVTLLFYLHRGKAVAAQQGEGY